MAVTSAGEGAADKSGDIANHATMHVAENYCVLVPMEWGWRRPGFIRLQPRLCALWSLHCSAGRAEASEQKSQGPKAHSAPCRPLYRGSLPIGPRATTNRRTRVVSEWLCCVCLIRHPFGFELWWLCSALCPDNHPRSLFPMLLTCTPGTELSPQFGHSLLRRGPWPRRGDRP